MGYIIKEEGDSNDSGFCFRSTCHVLCRHYPKHLTCISSLISSINAMRELVWPSHRVRSLGILRHRQVKAPSKVPPLVGGAGIQNKAVWGQDTLLDQYSVLLSRNIAREATPNVTVSPREAVPSITVSPKGRYSHEPAAKRVPSLMGQEVDQSQKRQRPGCVGECLWKVLLGRTQSLVRVPNRWSHTQPCVLAGTLLKKIR